MKWMLVGAAVATVGAACAMAACGDDTTDTSGSGGSTASSGTPASSGSPASSGATGGGGGGGPDCATVCGELYDCGLEDMNCPGFTPDGKMDFVDGCIPQCMTNPALASVVDPMNCAGTIMLIKGANPQFKDGCENGFGGGGGAGGGM